MKRLPITARPDFQEKIEADGLLWSTTENGPYWNEAMAQPVYYELTELEQTELEMAATVIHAACIGSITWMIEEAGEATRELWFDRFGIPAHYRQFIIDSWNKDEWSMYGRFDFVLTKDGPRLLEYNADTPTTLLETALSQWNWFRDNEQQFGQHFQFNELHEALVRHWSDMKKDNGVEGPVHFAAFSQIDDLSTVAYMAETAKEAGLDVHMLPIEQIGWNGQEFTDPNEAPVKNCFKLYPWEWMAEDEFGDVVPHADTRWIEAPWKMLLANKAILALLWERHPEIEWLVPCYIGNDDVDMRPGDKWVTKPLLSREGMNVKIWEIDQDGIANLVEGVDGDYDESEFVTQQYIEWNPIDGVYPMMGVWMVGDDPVALGIREDDSVITQNNSRFIPHVVKEG